MRGLFIIYGGKIIEITKDRIVMDIETPNEKETVIFRLQDRKQLIERIRKKIWRPVLQKPM